MGQGITAYSPLRVSFAGGGTDIEPFVDMYGSKLVNATIDRGVTVTYKDDHGPLEVSSRDHLSTTVSGVKAKRTVPFLIMKYLESLGISSGRVTIRSDVPPGSGLGSSSALITAIVKLGSILGNSSISQEELGRKSFHLEKEFFGITLGKQDPYSISFGGFKYMEIRGDTVSVSRFSDSLEFLRGVENNSLLVYTGKTRESSRVLKDQVERMRMGNGEIVERLKELRDLSPRLRKAIEDSDMEEFSEIINMGWEIKKSMNINATNPHVDNIIRRAMNSGAIAARLLGGGSQGFVYLLGRDGSLPELQRNMLSHSKFVIRIAFDVDGTRIIR